MVRVVLPVEIKGGNTAGTGVRNGNGPASATVIEGGCPVARLNSNAPHPPPPPPLTTFPPQCRPQRRRWQQPHRQQPRTHCPRTKTSRFGLELAFLGCRLIRALHLDRWDCPGYHKWPAHRFKFRVQEEGAPSLAGGRTAWRRCCVSEIGESQVTCRNAIVLMWHPKAIMVDRNVQYVLALKGYPVES